MEIGISIPAVSTIFKACFIVSFAITADTVGKTVFHTSVITRIFTLLIAIIIAGRIGIFNLVFERTYLGFQRFNLLFQMIEGGAGIRIVDIEKNAENSQYTTENG